MKRFIASALLLFSITSCHVKSTLIEARITNVTPYYESKHYDLPHVTFSISIKNRGNSATAIYVNHYGRDSSSDAGSWWVYYNGKVDSLELFSASCEHCYERTTLKPGDSLDLALKIHYSNVANSIASESPQVIEDEIKQVFETWNVVKYFDNKNNLLFEAKRRN